jgi:hypothetical protein
MTPVLIHCSRSAHDQNVLAQRPQWDQHGCHSKRERGKRALKDHLDGCEASDARSEGQSGDSLLKKKERAWKGHERAD